VNFLLTFINKKNDNFIGIPASQQQEIFIASNGEMVSLRK
jgi:hypothetical protein